MLTHSIHIKPTDSPAPGYSGSSCEAVAEAVEVLQPNGEMLSIIGVGNIRQSHIETVDGYTILRDSDGYFKYAQLSAGGKLKPTSVVAHNPNERDGMEMVHLASLQPHLRQLAGNTPLQKQNGAEPGNSFPKTGSHKLLLLLIQYPDLGSTFAAANFDNMMNLSGYGANGSFADYFFDNSYGQLNLQTDVFGWYTAQHNYEYYGRANGYNRSRELVTEAIDAAEAAGLDFSQYDNDGDGILDGIMVVHAGQGAEFGAQLQYVWSHRWDLEGGYARNYDNVLIADYIIQPETREWQAGVASMVGIGVFCHEFGHLVGLPDLYDTDASNGASQGLGHWCLMGAGNWLNHEHTPAGLSAWAKTQLGWLSPQLIESADTFLLQPAHSHAQCFRINTPDSLESFLLEYRMQQGWDAYLPGHGLMITHVHEGVTGRYPGSNDVNADANLKGVDLEAADGQFHMDLGLNRGDAGDLFPGITGNTAFNDVSLPSSLNYSGGNSGVCIQGITEANGIISFNTHCAAPCSATANFAHSAAGLAVSFNALDTMPGILYHWSFGDGGWSKLQNPTHFFAVSGSYQVCLEIAGSCGEISSCQTVNVVAGSCNQLPMPAPGFAASVHEGCVPLIVDFSSNLQSDAYTEWLINGETVSNQHNLTNYSIESLGTQLIFMVVGDGNCVQSFADSILVTADCIWPGDVDNDGIVGLFDWLALGLAMNDSAVGSARAEQSLDWSPKEAADWGSSSPDGINHKFADTNGDGVVNASDTTAIVINFGLERLGGSAVNMLNGSGVAEVTPLMVQNSSGNEGDIIVELYLTDVLDTVPLELSGFAFEYYYRGVDPKVDFSESCMGEEGTDFITLVKDFGGLNKLFVAVASLNGHNLYCTERVVRVITREEPYNTETYQAPVLANAVLQNAGGELLAIGAQPTVAAQGVVQAVRLQANVLLEECFDENAGCMKTADMEQIRNMRQNALLQAHLPEMGRLPAKLAGWVRVEALNQNFEMVESHPALLLSDGSLASVADFSKGVEFATLKQGEAYYMAVRHSNHLDVMSAQPVNVSGTAVAIDFTLAENVAGTNQLSRLPNGKYALSAGDFNGDGLISVHDINLKANDWRAVETYKTNAGKIGMPVLR